MQVHTRSTESAVMVAHHVVHAVIGAVQLVVGRGDWCVGHRRERGHRAAGRIH